MSLCIFHISLSLFQTTMYFPVSVILSPLADWIVTLYFPPSTARSSRDATSKVSRSISHTVSRVTSGGGAASLLAVAGRIACIDVSLFKAFSCPWTPPSTFYKLLEIARWRSATASVVHTQEMRVPARRVTRKRRVSNTALIEWCKLLRG